MDDALREALRAQLLERREALRERLSGSDESTERVEIDSACQSKESQLSRTESAQVREMARALRARWKRELGRVDGALRRIENEEYGNCFVCGEPIPARRLQNDPSVTRCVECAEDE
ncbi:TraR/DksA family transcriptional regulator [Guyparkeria hydrothermalis]|uniref:TraR/DksA family transcriptional regulator n=1 Tax=Guyparkeria halophila TaxID=47960 RepID=A0A6I6DC87_9GAMM|nr:MULTISPECIES: TraR/DksA family transcriptional regulator [Guyparkeria]MCL7750590.1 TraR/DksA family transcriptional regulator [Guyparkeria hydrothermalis]QGT79412.1 TraR/DksA family transcriptional regulator [Guyparkeria halophila]TKA88611.1 TraR/DksA family transcriptional regulator [Guyparkeria sp. SB14A]